MSRVSELLEESLRLHHLARNLRNSGKKAEGRTALTQSAGRRMRAVQLDPSMEDEGWQSPVKGLSGQGSKTHREIHERMIAHYHALGCYRGAMRETELLRQEERRG